MKFGTIQPIEEIARIAKMYNIIFHTDAVQACGNVQIDVKTQKIDLLSLSGHKIYAPKGVGALYVKTDTKFKTYIDGGHQEKEKRAGTENVASIVGLGKACEISKKILPEYMKKNRMLRDYYIQQIADKIENIEINGTINQRISGNANISFIGVDSNELLSQLDNKGICASSGSACSSGIKSNSHVLKAMGLDQTRLNSAIRTTFGDENTKDDIDYLVKSLSEIVRELRKLN